MNSYPLVFKGYSYYLYDKRIRIHTTIVNEKYRRDVVMQESALTEQIIGGAIEVHKHWGPGLYEEIYQKSLCHELWLRKIKIASEVKLPLLYKGKAVGDDLRLDLIVEDKVVLELKSVKSLEPVHEAQLLTYLKLTGCKIGLLINFNVPVLKQGIKRMVL